MATTRTSRRTKSSTPRRRGRKLSKAGVRLIAGFEGFRSDLYDDAAGHCTIGYGHLVHHGACDGAESGEFRKGLTRERALELLAEDAASAAAVNDAVTVPLDQNQFDALTSFVFNVGAGAFRESTLLKLLNQGKYEDVPEQLDCWVKAGGRSKETDPFLTRPTTFIETEGTSLKTALDVARKFGVVRDYLPFTSGKLYAGQAKTFYAIATLRKILAYFNLGVNLSTWRNWLATKGPILVRLDVDTTWDDATYNGGNMDDYNASSTRGRACGRDRRLYGRPLHRPEQLGHGLGDRGFGYGSLAYAQEAFTEAYGVEV